LTLDAGLAGTRLRLRLGYRPDVFTQAEVEDVMAGLRGLLTALAADPETPVGAVDDGGTLARLAARPSPAPADAPAEPISAYSGRTCSSCRPAATNTGSRPPYRRCSTTTTRSGRDSSAAVPAAGGWRSRRAARSTPPT